MGEMMSRLGVSEDPSGLPHGPAYVSRPSAPARGAVHSGLQYKPHRVQSSPNGIYRAATLITSGLVRGCFKPSQSLSDVLESEPCECL